MFSIIGIAKLLIYSRHDNLSYQFRIYLTSFLVLNCFIRSVLCLAVVSMWHYSYNMKQLSSAHLSPFTSIVECATLHDCSCLHVWSPQPHYFYLGLLISITPTIIIMELAKHTCPCNVGYTGDRLKLRIKVTSCSTPFAIR